MKALLTIFICCTIFFCYSGSVLAQGFKATYNFDFYPQQSGRVKVELRIALNSLRPDVYIDQFALSIPNNFFSEKLVASIDAGNTDYKIESKKEGKRIIFTFDEPDSEDIAADHTIKLAYAH